MRLGIVMGLGMVILLKSRMLISTFSASIIQDHCGKVQMLYHFSYFIRNLEFGLAWVWYDVLCQWLSEVFVSLM